jgi:pimeloyl-ACP methyl ester carboxylesterase
MIESRIVTANHEGQRLVGLEARPEHLEGPLPTVLLVHGFFGTKEERGLFDAVTRVLTGGGLAVFRFDFSGCGESEGHYVDTSPSKMVAELGAMLAFTRTRPEVDTGRLGLLGHCMGVNTILALAPEHIRCAVLMAAPARPLEYLPAFMGEGYNPRGISSRHTSLGTRCDIGPRFFTDAAGHGMVERMRRWHVPALFLHNADDRTVPSDDSRLLHEVALPPKELLLLPGSSHTPRHPSLYEALLRWYGQFLTGPDDGRTDTTRPAGRTEDPGSSLLESPRQAHGV